MMIINSYRYAGGAPAAWTPADLTDLFAWYDPSDAATITEVGGSVSQLDDKKATFDISQGVGADQPNTGTRTLNSQNVLDYDGTDALERLNTFSLGLSDYTVISVGQCDVNTSSMLLNFTEGTTRALQINKNTNSYQIFVWHGATFRQLAHSDNGAPNDAFINSAVVNFNTDVKSYLNGGNEQVGVITTPAIDIDTIALGKWYVNASSRWDGAIGEVIICNAAISVSDRQKAEGYLAHKYGLTAKLPAAHPYKTVAP